ncbi:MAG: hypothetical protein K2X80_17365 [Pseudomonadaceae bacterium]|nr:hypothetical protein [Pseudomonadaceae bacterium]
MAGNKINMLEVADMVRHWLATPVNGFLGSSYGNDAKSLLQQPHNAGLADGFLQKLIKDVPILYGMPSGTVNLYMETVSKDRVRLIIDLAGTQVSTDTLGNIT